MQEGLAIIMFVVVCLVIMAGYPVAFTLGGTALIFAGIGMGLDLFDVSFLQVLPNRLFGLMANTTLIAVPLFIFMGNMLERSKVAEDLLHSMALLFGRLRGGLGFSVVLVGMLLAASTGIVGATVVTMGLLSLPLMLKRGYDPALSAGVICASGTLGQIIPPSIILVLLGDVLSASYQQAQINMGIFSPETVSMGDLFAGALFPGLLLVGLYLLYLAITATVWPSKLPALTAQQIAEKPHISEIMRALLPPFLLIISVLGSILLGVATPTEAASVGAVGALLLALLKGELNLACLRQVMRRTLTITSMVFMIFIGAALFSLVFRGFAGDELIHRALNNLPGGAFSATWVVMALMFVLGFVLDFIEIIFVVVPIVTPILLSMGLNPVWLGVMFAMNLQTSFLTPPFGFALFYLRGVAPKELKTSDIYRGVVPFIVIQLIAMGILALWPALATWLPHWLYDQN
jgi:tripartite ATP-independent transporter DctM subunit